MMITNQLLTAEAYLPGWTVRVVFGATLVWLAATLLVFAVRTASAAVRHRVWALSVVAALALPALIAALPELRTGWLDLRLAGGPLADVPSAVDRDGEYSRELALRRDSAVTATSIDALADLSPTGTSRATAEPETSDNTAETLSAATVPFHQTSAAVLPSLWNWMLGWFMLWAVPAAVGLVWTARSMHAARRLVREAEIVDDEHCRGLVRSLAPSFGRRCAVELRESGATLSPLCVGWRWPTIVLPRGWRVWPEGHLAAAVAHELAHVVRRDVGWQLLARMACALYWFHPLAWVAAWRMRVEREAACDDWALASGQAPTRYARVLLDLASQLSAPHPRPPTAAVAMAGGRGFERRIRAIVAQRRRRQPVARSVAWLLAFATLGVVVVAGTISPLASSRADTEPGSSASKTTKASATEGVKTEAVQSTLRVKGHAVDEQGRGVSGAQVEAFAHRSRPSTDSARDGEFELDVPRDPRIPLTLRATADDGSRQAFYQITDVEQLPPAVQLVLRPAREIPMTVVDDQGKPVAGAWVAAMVHWFNLMDEATTDVAGKAVLRVPADANMQYVVADKPNVGLDYFVYRRPDETASDPYKLPPDHPEALVLVLNGARTVTVRVVDHDEQPMAGLPVTPWYFEKPKKGDILNIGGEHFRVLSDEHGGAVFRAVPIDNSTPITFWTGREEHFMPERTVFDPQSGVTELTATLLPLVPVSGRVTFADGRPAAGAEVQIDGRGHQVDSFHKSLRTGEDGRFEIRVNPDQFYLFGALLDRWATPLESRVVRLGIPLDDVDLVLQRATRLYGRLTIGIDPKPVSGENLCLSMYRDDDEHLLLPKDEQLPNPNNDNKSIQPRITRNTKTGDQGEFEFLVGPGHGYLLGPKGVKPPLFVVVDQDELELNLHADRPDRVELAGRVVLRAALAQGIGDVSVLGVAHNGNGMFIKAASGDDGSFRVQRTPCEMLLYALSADRLWGAIARLGPDDSRVVIPVAPTAAATGRLVDATSGRPLTQRQLKFAVKEGFTIFNVFGGSTSSNIRGEFVLDGLVPGCEYQLEVAIDRDQDGQAHDWLTTGYVKPESAETVDLGDVKLTPKDRAPTLAELIDRAFQRSAPLETRLRGGLLEAKSNEQRLLVLVTQRESAAAHGFFSHLYHLDDDEVPDRRVRQFLDDYVLLVVDAGQGEQHDDSRRFVEKLGLEWPQADAASIAVSGTDGELLGRTMLRVLPADGQLDRERLANFLREHAPKPADAEQLLDEALIEAKKQGKRVLIQHSGAFSGPCVLLSRFLDAHRELLAKDYICVKLDERFAHGELIMASLRRQDATSIPWIVIIDAGRKRLATSDAEWGNIGYPDSPAAIQHFEKMLRETARNLTDDDIESLVRDLAK
ncbi:MAG TPA: M56 family metallopeptidase [Pirellulales bacterium]|nr:M56 family metallopeptidase [Pirellulales bacterium]